MVTVRVPASSANMGAGFDTLGVGIGLYNTVTAEEIPSGLEIEIKNRMNYIPRGENNLIYRAMMKVFERVGYKPRGIRITQRSAIPVTRGLGSSSACIIGGMLAANCMSGRKLDYSEILNLALEMEGHPDNIAPALYGGLCVSMVGSGGVITKSIKLDPKIKFAAMVPDFFVQTKKSRGALPDMVSYSDAVFNISRTVMFAALLASGQTENLREAVRDKLHQPYRSAGIYRMEDIFEQSYRMGSKATYLSGSGPTIVSVLDADYDKFAEGMREYFGSGNMNYSCRILTVDNVGAVVKTSN